MPCYILLLLALSNFIYNGVFLDFTTLIGIAIGVFFINFLYPVFLKEEFSKIYIEYGDSSLIIKIKKNKSYYIFLTLLGLIAGFFF